MITDVKTPSAEDILDGFKHYCDVVTDVINTHYRTNFPSLTPDTVAVMPGSKNWKVVLVRSSDGRSVHSFVSRSTGEIFKPAGWGSPAKHARGNVLDADHGRSALDSSGHVKYLR